MNIPKLYLSFVHQSSVHIQPIVIIILLNSKHQVTIVRHTVCCYVITILDTHPAHHNLLHFSIPRITEQ